MAINENEKRSRSDMKLYAILKMFKCSLIDQNSEDFQSFLTWNRKIQRIYKSDVYCIDKIWVRPPNLVAYGSNRVSYVHILFQFQYYENLVRLYVLFYTNVKNLWISRGLKIKWRKMFLFWAFWEYFSLMSWKIGCFRVWKS